METTGAIKSTGGKGPRGRVDQDELRKMVKESPQALGEGRAGPFSSKNTGYGMFLLGFVVLL